jgi:hypothetical protein
MDVDFEGEAVGYDGVSYYPPTPYDLNVDDGLYFANIGMGAFPAFDTNFPALVSGSTINTASDCKTNTASPSNYFSLNWSRTRLDGSTADRIATAYYPCSIRRADAQNPTRLSINGTFSGDSKDYVHVYGVSGGARVIEGTCLFSRAGGEVTFAPVSAVDVDGFEMEVDVGTGYAVNALLASGTVNANDPSGATLVTTIGQYYAFRNSGGPWWSGVANNYGYYVHNASNTVVLIPLTEVIDGVYIIRFYAASEASMIFTVADYLFSDNTGTLGYSFFSATVGERIISLTNSTVRNVCAR